MEQPLISIITPSFNQAKWLETCILSVLNQNYSNFEYIIIDGGSTDESVSIIKKYEDKLAYWQSKPDGGQAKALNIGYKKAKGQIIAYLNADDCYEPGCFESVVRTYEVNQEYAIYYGKCKTIDAEGNLLHEGQGDQIKFSKLLKDGMLPHMFQPACFFNHRYLNREYFINEKFNLAFDYELILSLAQQKSILFLNRDFASYRVHKDSKSQKLAKEAYKEKLSIQQQFSKGDFLLWQWRKLKFNIADKTGHFAKNKAAL
ncbi:MAG: glycosyltransferase family 2 protein [Bacteroidia bacterium]